MRWQKRFRYHKNFILVVFFACMLPLTYAAANINKTPLSLKEAVLLALRYNPSVRNAELQRTIDKFNLRLQQNTFEVQYALTGDVNTTQIRTAGITTTNTNTTLSPQASLLTPYGTQINVAWNDNHQGGSYQPSTSLSINQPLLSGFGRDINQANLRNQEDQEVINKLALKNQITSTITNVITAYHGLVLANNNLITAKLSLKSLQDTVKEDEALIASGRKAPTEIVQAQAQLANQQLNLQQSANQVEQARLNLLNILGIEPNSSLVVTNAINLLAMPKLSKEECIRLALQNDITYQSAQRSMQILKRNLLVAKDQARWQLNLNANTTLGGGVGATGNTGLNNLGDSYNHNLGLKLNIPISNLPQKAAIAGARIALEQQDIQTQALKTQITNNIVTALYNLQSSFSVVQQGEKANSLSQQTLAIAKAKLRYGRVSTFEVVNLERDYNSSLIANTANKIAYLDALANFQQALGITLATWGIEIRD